MKKIFLFILILVSLKGFSQYPVNTSAGSANTLWYQQGGVGANLGFVYRMSYGDTAAANLSFIKNVPGHVIRVGDTLWMRNVLANTWLRQGPAIGAGSGTVTNVATGLWLGGGPITTTGTIQADSSDMAAYFLRRKDSGVSYTTPTWVTNAIAGITESDPSSIHLSGTSALTGNTDVVTNGNRFKLDYTDGFSNNIYWQFQNGRIDYTGTDGANTATMYQDPSSGFYFENKDGSNNFGFVDVNATYSNFTYRTASGIEAGLINYYSGSGSPYSMLSVGTGPLRGIWMDTSGVKIGRGPSGSDKNLQGFQVLYDRINIQPPFSALYIDSLLASSDTTYKPLAINSSGQVKKMTYWPGSGGGTPAGNYGNVQLNRNGVFVGTDSLDFDAGLLITGDLAATGQATFNTLRVGSSQQFTVSNTGNLKIKNVQYDWPSAIAAGAGYVLTDVAGDGTLTWAAPSDGGSTLTLQQVITNGHVLDVYNDLFILPSTGLNIIAGDTTLLQEHSNIYIDDYQVYLYNQGPNGTNYSEVTLEETGLQIEYTNGDSAANFRIAMDDEGIRFFDGIGYGNAGDVWTSDANGYGRWQAPSGGVGSGTVNSGTANQFAIYPTTGTAVSGTSGLTYDGTDLTLTGNLGLTGQIAMLETAAPFTPPAGSGIIWHDNSDGKLYFKTSTATYDLTAAGSSYTDEQAQDAVGSMATNSSKVSLTYVDGTPSLTADIVAGSLVNADINAGAAIALSKLQAITDGVLLGAQGGTAVEEISLTANDFNLSSNTLSLDYTNAQKATTSTIGFLTDTDWDTFNDKQAALVSGTNIKTINGSSVLGSGDLSVTASAAGSDRELQFNNSGALGASSHLKFQSDFYLRLTDAYLYMTSSDATMPIYASYSSSAASSPIMILNNADASSGQTAMSFNFNNVQKARVRVDKDGNIVFEGSGTTYFGYNGVADNTDMRFGGSTERMFINGSTGEIKINNFITQPEITTPSTPASGYWRIYPTSTGFKQLSPAGVETSLGGGASTFAALTDVNLTSIAANDFLKWDGTDWINRTPVNVKTDLSLNNVDNTSDATKNAASVSLTNKTIAAATNNVEGTFIGVRVLTSGTTYTPTSGTTKIVVFLQGGGGGGGGGGAGSSAIGLSGGGGSGAYAIKYVTNVQSTYTYAIGAAGTAGSGAANGGNGGSTTFATNAGSTPASTTITAPGGSGGINLASGTSNITTLGGAGATVATNGDLNEGGQPGNWGLRISGTVGISGIGANSNFGTGGNAVNTSVNGNAATGFGAGGGGALKSGTGAVTDGGVGTAGVIVVYEYR
jgi:hypothetical protein